jgi:hypothetical protein
LSFSFPFLFSLFLPHCGMCDFTFGIKHLGM